MRRERMSGWRHWSLAAVAALGLAILSPLTDFSGRLFAIDGATSATATATPAAEAISASLKTLFAGGVPGSVADLKAMQTHVQTLTEKLKKCTVGVTVGNAQGSGVIISKDGYVLTAAHVAGGPNRTDHVTLTLADGREVKGKTLGLYRTLDAGLMKITDQGEYPFAEMGASTNLRDGQWCLALGHPGGYQEDRGIVLRVGRVLYNDDKAITTDCTLVGGDSGGPLFDMAGRVIGINSRIATDLTANMHVPVSTFKDVWERLEKGEAWGRLPGQEPWLGVKGVDTEKFAQIESVTPGSPADDAGIKSGDIIISYDGQNIANFAALKAKVNEWQPFGRRGGGESSIVVLRKGEMFDLKLRLRPKD